MPTRNSFRHYFSRQQGRITAIGETMMQDLDYDADTEAAGTAASSRTRPSSSTNSSFEMGKSGSEVAAETPTGLDPNYEGVVFDKETMLLHVSEEPPPVIGQILGSSTPAWMPPGFPGEFWSHKKNEVEITRIERLEDIQAPRKLPQDLLERLPTLSCAPEDVLDDGHVAEVLERPLLSHNNLQPQEVTSHSSTTLRELVQAAEHDGMKRNHRAQAEDKSQKRDFHFEAKDQGKGKLGSTQSHEAAGQMRLMLGQQAPEPFSPAAADSESTAKIELAAIRNAAPAFATHSSLVEARTPFRHSTNVRPAPTLRPAHSAQFPSTRRAELSSNIMNADYWRCNPDVTPKPPVQTVPRALGKSMPNLFQEPIAQAYLAGDMSFGHLAYTSYTPDEEVIDATNEDPATWLARHGIDDAVSHTLQHQSTDYASSETARADSDWDCASDKTVRVSQTQDSGGFPNEDLRSSQDQMSASSPFGTIESYRTNASSNANVDATDSPPGYTVDAPPKYAEEPPKYASLRGGSWPEDEGKGSRKDSLGFSQWVMDALFNNEAIEHEIHQAIIRDNLTVSDVIGDPGQPRRTERSEPHSPDDSSDESEAPEPDNHANGNAEGGPGAIGMTRGDSEAVPEGMPRPSGNTAPPVQPQSSDDEVDPLVYDYMNRNRRFSGNRWVDPDAPRQDPEQDQQRSETEDEQERQSSELAKQDESSQSEPSELSDLDESEEEREASEAEETSGQEASSEPGTSSQQKESSEQRSSSGQESSGEPNTSRSNSLRPGQNRGGHKRAGLRGGAGCSSRPSLANQISSYPIFGRGNANLLDENDSIHNRMGSRRHNFELQASSSDSFSLGKSAPELTTSPAQEPSPILENRTLQGYGIIRGGVNTGYSVNDSHHERSRPSFWKRFKQYWHKIFKAGPGTEFTAQHGTAQEIPNGELPAAAQEAASRRRKVTTTRLTGER